MRLILHTIAHLLLWAACSYGQCPGGCCEDGSCPPPGQRMIADAPSDNQASRPMPSRCRISIDGSIGSGTLVCAGGGSAIVITAHHVVKDSSGVAVVSFPDGRQFQGCVVDKDEFYDLAAISISDPGIEPAEVDTDTSGVLVAAGFGSDGSFRSVRGSITGYVLYDGQSNSERMPKMQGQVRPGDSGGGVINTSKKFVGVVWGAKEGETYLTCGRPLQNFLSRICRRCQSAQPTRPTTPVPPAPLDTPPPVQTPPMPTVDPSARDDKYDGELAAMHAEIADLRKQLSEFKECNCDGCCDKVRAELNAKIEVLAASNVMIATDVKNLQASQPNYDQLAAEVAKRLPPINFRVLDPRGAGYSTEYQPAKLGQYVTLPFGPAVK